MMRRLCWLLPLLMIACSCQRAPVADSETDAAAAADASATPSLPPAGAAVTDVPLDVPLDALSAVAAGAPDPGTVVRDYLSRLPGHDAAALDAVWQIPPPAGRADDAALRELRDIISLRVNTGAAVARDQQHPSRLMEVPVRVRALTVSGTLRFTGWYRLSPDADDSAWRIQSAQLQPVLD